LTYISADLTREQAAPGQAAAQAGQASPAYYVVRVTLPPDELKRLDEFRILPGMPAEVFIQTQTRTALSYLLKPLREQVSRAFRER
jgi:membrane fusion protein, type I secretion system